MKRECVLPSHRNTSAIEIGTEIATEQIEKKMDCEVLLTNELPKCTVKVRRRGKSQVDKPHPDRPVSNHARLSLGSRKSETMPLLSRYRAPANDIKTPTQSFVVHGDQLILSEEGS